MEELRDSLLAPAAGTVFMVLGCASAITSMNAVRYNVKDDNGKMLLSHPYKPWAEVPKGKETEWENSFRAFKMYENVKEWTFLSLPLMWTFSCFGGAIPYANGNPRAVEAAVMISSVAWMVGNKWYIEGYIKSTQDRMPGFTLRLQVFKFWLFGSLAGVAGAGLERFGVSLPGK